MNQLALSINLLTQENRTDNEKRLEGHDGSQIVEQDGIIQNMSLIDQ